MSHNRDNQIEERSLDRNRKKQLQYDEFMLTVKGYYLVCLPVWDKHTHTHMLTYAYCACYKYQSKYEMLFLFGDFIGQN